MTRKGSSETADRTEKELIEKTGRASGDTDKPVQEKFDEMGEKDAVKKPSRRE